MTTFNDSWLSQAFTLYTNNTFPTPLENTFYNLSDDPFSPLSDMVRTESTTSPFTSPSVSGSDNIDTPTQKRSHAACNKMITKRKSRKNTTTFVNADVSSFREVVQQMTGGSVKLRVGKVVKPEPKRVGFRFHGCLPTLDTSSFLVDGCQGFVACTPTTTEGGVGFSRESFPTLESWVGL